MKSVTVYDEKGRVLIKVIHRKNGQCELIRDSTLGRLGIEVRDDGNNIVHFPGLKPAQKG